MFALGLGHEVAGLVAVLVAFFSGMALGAVALDGRVSRSNWPGRWYAILEISIGLWGLATLALIPRANRFAALFVGTDTGPFWNWTVALLVPLAVLMPATAAMGATLPAMDRLVSRLRGDGRSVGGLYGAGTLGGVAGTLGTTYLTVPEWGYETSLLILASLNLLCGLAVLTRLPRGEMKRTPVNIPVPDLLSSPRLRLSLLTSGVLGIGYEVLAIRVLSQVLANTVYSFASALSVYLLSTGVYVKNVGGSGFLPFFCGII